MPYLISTKPDGDKLWWHEDEFIPRDHTDVRGATAEEARLMDEIIRQDSAGYMPSLELGDAIKRLMARHHSMTDMELENASLRSALRNLAAEANRTLNTIVVAKSVDQIRWGALAGALTVAKRILGE